MQWKVIIVSEGHIIWGVSAGLQPQKTPETPKPKFKKQHFCRQDHIKRFMCFTLQAKSASELG